MGYKHVLGQAFYERAADTVISGSPEERLAVLNELWNEHHALCVAVDENSPLQDEECRRSAIFRAISEERDRQDTKWGYPQANTFCEWASILGEEYGELAKELNELNFGRGDLRKMVDEATQVAAVAVSIISQASYAADITEKIRDIRSREEIFKHDTNETQDAAADPE